jgi:hypothetical protein
MIKRPWLSAVGLSVYLCITLWMQRTGGSRLHAIDLAGSCLVAVLSVAVGWLASAALTKDIHRRGLIALVAGLWGLLFSSFQLMAASALGSSFQSPVFAVAIWTALCFLACLVISRGSGPLVFATKALGIATMLLLATQLVQAVPVLMHAQAAEVGTDRGRENSAPRPSAVPKAVDRRDGRLPDVFLIVLDKYSSGAWLSHTYGVDHKPFEDSLRALGFVVPTAARGNYAHTQIALASFLNWRYIENSAGQPKLSWNGMRALIDTARVWDAFKVKGYRLVTIPTTFPATRSLANADVELRPDHHQPVPFAETWRVNSPLSLLPSAKKAPMPYPGETLKDIEWKLRTLQSLPDSAGPVFAFMHLLSPHEPYLFNPDCSPREPWWPLTDQGADFERIRKAYAVQVVCLDRMLLRTVQSLLARPGVRPVIILQADHGHGQISVDPLRGFTLTEQELSPERLGERFGIFAGYLFPGADTAIYNDISAVNVMPLVIRSLFGTAAARLPDRSLWSSYQDAFRFSEVDPALTRPPQAGTTRDR